MTATGDGTTLRAGGPEVERAAYVEREELTAALFERRAGLPPGDPRARRIRDRIIELHLPLAEQLTRRFGQRGPQAEDLLQVARLGLVQAVDRFELTYGVPFLGYAIPTITGELKRHIRDKGWSVRVPRHLQELHLAINRASTDLVQRLHRSPTVADLAAHLDVTEETIIEGLAAAQALHATSLSTPVGPETQDATLADVLGGPDPGIAAVNDHDALRQGLAKLPDRDRRIMIMRFFGNRTQTEIADELGISQMHVSRLISRSLTALRQQMNQD